MSGKKLQTSQQIHWLTVDEWQEFVEGQVNSFIFHHRKWLELLHGHYGFQIRIPSIASNGRIRVAIPFLQTRNLRGRKKLISLPFTDYVPVLSQEQLAVATLCQTIQNDLRDKYDTIIIRSDEPISGFESVSHGVRHEMRTDIPLEQIEASFDTAIRRNLLKAERKQLEFVKRTDDSAIEIFYRLHVLTRKRLGVPVQSKSYFRKLNHELIANGLGFVGLVTKENRPIAAGVFLGFNGRLIYKYAASDPCSLDHRPNDWLVYNSIRLAAEEGYRIFDFGITDRKQEGLRRFKSKWGATESDVFYNQVLGEPDRNIGPSCAVRIASEIIKRSPTAVCRVLGKAFYKYSQ